MVSDTEHLVITDTFVGVCCTSLKKICDILKRHCLGNGEPAPRTSRNTEYDNLVMPCYRRFPSNAEACANITRRDWNPPWRWSGGGPSSASLKGGLTEGSPGCYASPPSTFSSMEAPSRR